MAILIEETSQSKPVVVIDERKRSRTIIGRDHVAANLALRSGPTWSACDPTRRNIFRRQAEELLMLFAVDIHDEALQARLRDLR